MLHGLRTAGAKVFEFNTDENPEALDSEGRPYDRGTSGPVWLIREKVFPLIIRFHPHVIICNAGGLSFRPNDADTLHKWGVKLLGIALSEPDVYVSTTSKIAGNFDVFYSNDQGSVGIHRSNDVNAYQLPIGTDESFFHPVPARPEYLCDVLHLGAAHPDRIESVKALVENFKTHVYGENWEKYGIVNRGFVFGEDTRSALSSAKVVVVFSRTPAGHQIIKPQIFNFLSSGCLVATEIFPELQEYFEEDKEIIGFNGKADMLEKIKYYIDHPEEANAVRRAGREKALQFTWDKVWLKLIPALVPIKK
jgi:glycosyltransferase involved in cell wall biosynthesis